MDYYELGLRCSGSTDLRCHCVEGGVHSMDLSCVYVRVYVYTLLYYACMLQALQALHRCYSVRAVVQAARPLTDWSATKSAAACMHAVLWPPQTPGSQTQRPIAFRSFQGSAIISGACSAAGPRTGGGGIRDTNLAPIRAACAACVRSKRPGVSSHHISCLGWMCRLRFAAVFVAANVPGVVLTTCRTQTA